MTVYVPVIEARRLSREVLKALSPLKRAPSGPRSRSQGWKRGSAPLPATSPMLIVMPSSAVAWNVHGRSEEHTSELQSQSNLVCRLLLEKKKKKKKKTNRQNSNTKTEYHKTNKC